MTLSLRTFWGASLALVFLGLTSLSLQAEKPETAGETAAARAYPLSEIGERVRQKHEGQGLGIQVESGKVTLRVDFQKLTGAVDPQGLRLTSSGEGETDASFRVKAAALGRAGLSMMPLAEQGAVKVMEETVSFQRPGLTEEYQVSPDGIRQDFVLMQRPAGEGLMRMALAIEGAAVAPASYGAKLTLEGSGREIAYSRLKVTDALGRELAAHFVAEGDRALAIQVDDADAVYPVRIDPTFSDADWVSLDAGVGTDGIIYTSIVDGSGNLYIGGTFTQVAGVAALNVAKWNGSVWSAMGTGLNSQVKALAVIGSDVYAGGLFGVNAGTSTYVAKWNGSTWSGLGSGTNSTVEALAVIGTDLYAGGSFSSANGVSANKVAKWNGTVWSALGSGVSLSTGFGFVSALAATGTDLYVGGYFDTAGGTAGINSVARYSSTGGGWSALGSGIPGEVDSLAASGSTVYAGGLFLAPGSAFSRNVSVWNGSAWGPLGDGVSPGARVRRLVISGTDVYVGGEFGSAGAVATGRIAKWTGSAWSFLGTGVGGGSVSVNAISLLPNGDLFAGGSFTTAGGSNVNYMATWNGTAWSAQKAGVNNNVLAVATDGTNLYIGGSFTSVAGIPANRVAKWNGSAWSALGSGVNGDVYALTPYDGGVVVGGNFSTAGGNPANSIAHYTAGGSWATLGTGVSGIVSSLAYGGGGLYVGGSFNTAGGEAASNIARWTGTFWAPLGSGTNGYVLSIFASPTSSVVHIGGAFTTAGGNTVNHIARWDGAVWNALGEGMNNDVQALAFLGSDLYAGGTFTIAGGVSGSRISRWDGNAWNTMGQGADNAVNALVSSGPYLYVGGLFTNAGGVTSNRIARWNGSAWSTMGSGADAGITAMAVAGNKLYAGGYFANVGGKGAGRIAQANLPLEPEISVTGNSVEIVSGDSTPTLDDLTNFGSVNVTAWSIDRTFTIINFGDGVLNLTGTPRVAISGAHAADFTVSAPPAATVPASSSRTFTVNFNPSALGTRTALITIANDDANENPYTFAIQGRGTLPEIEISGNGNSITNGDSTPSATDFTDFGGGIVSLSQITRTFGIANTGEATLYFSGLIEVTGPHASDFMLTEAPSSFMEGGVTSTFTIRFQPGGSGLRQATVTIPSNDPDENPFVFAIQGRGYNYVPVPAAQTITFAPPAKVFVGQINVPMLATSSAGLPVSLEVLSGPGSIVGSNLVLNGTPGVVKIRATQPGNPFFLAAKPVDKTITVQANPTTLTLIRLAQTYTGTTRPVTTLGGSGPATITYGKDNSPTPPIHAGSYPVKAVAGGVTKTGTLVITKAPLVVAADFQRKLVNQNNPALTFRYAGFVNGETAAAVTTEPLVTTTAKVNSPAGSYPITPSKGTAANYSFIYVKNVLSVEGFAGLYEALLLDPLTQDPTAKLELNLAAGNTSFTGKLTTIGEVAAVAIKGTLTTTFSTEMIEGIGSGKAGANNYNVSFTVPLQGDFTASVTRNGTALNAASNGKKLLVKPATLSYVGAHTLLLAPPTGTGSKPEGSGYATAKVNTNGSLAIAGKLADGTTLTATLASDAEAGYRLLVLPYKRLNSYLGGGFTLTPHPTVIGRREVSAASNTLLVWAKEGKTNDASYRSGFGILDTQLTMTPWQPPVAAKGAVPGITLAQRLGMTENTWTVAHTNVDSDAAPQLPTSVSLALNNQVSVLQPVTTPLNATAWKITLTPTTGAFTGSFVLKDEVVSGSPAVTKIVPRTVKFNGVLRQPETSGTNAVIGAGHFLVPALPGASSTEQISGSLQMTAP